MPKRDNGHFYPDLDISVAGRQATRYRTTYDMQEELEEAQAEAKFCEDRSVNPYDHSIRDDESVNNDQSTGTVLESDAGLSVVNKTAPFTDLSHTKANGMLSVIENITGAPYAGLFVSGAPGLQAQTVRFKKFIEELEKRCGAPLSHLILIDEKPLGKLVKQFNKTVANATRDLAERNETIAEFGTAIRQMETDMSRDVTERDERITELGGRIAELEGICRENEALEARIREGIKENEALKGRDVDRAQKNVGLEGTVVALRNHNHYMERKLNEHEGLPSGLCHTCNRIDPEEVAGGHYH